jgi:hypothetical protein
LASGVVCGAEGPEDERQSDYLPQAHFSRKNGNAEKKRSAGEADLSGEEQATLVEAVDD